VLIEQGRLQQAGPVHEVAASYLNPGGLNQGERTYAEGPYAPGDGVVKLRRVRVRSRAGETLATVELGDELGIEMEFEVQDSSARVLFPVLSVRNEWGTEVLWTTDAGAKWHGQKRPPGRYRVVAWVPPNFLSSGVMTVTAAVHSFLPWKEHFREVDAVGFQAIDTLGAGTARGAFTGPISAATRPKLEWTVDYQGDGHLHGVGQSTSRSVIP
jgi:lipopolysaccharide transport system ATP-binding protein